MTHFVTALTDDSLQLNSKTKDLRGSQAVLHTLEKSYAALDANYKVLAQNHTLLVLEVMRQLAYLKTCIGKPLEQGALAQIIAQIAQRLPAEEVHFFGYNVLFTI